MLFFNYCVGRGGLWWLWDWIGVGMGEDARLLVRGFCVEGNLLVWNREFKRGSIVRYLFFTC